MSNTPIQQFFKEHGISEVEAVVPDMAGIARGKPQRDHIAFERFRPCAQSIRQVRP